MSKLSRYCKAYYLRDVRACEQWAEPATNDPGAARPEDAIVYVQEDFAVTEGIARDEGVLYDGANDRWKAFCNDVLHFEVPAWCLEAPEPEAETVSA